MNSYRPTLQCDRTQRSETDFCVNFFTLKGSLSCHEFHITVKNAVGSFDFRLFDHVQVCLNSLSRLFKRRSNPYRGFTQSVGLGYSLWEGCLNWINILLQLTFGPLDTVRRNNCSGESCGLTKDLKFRTQFCQTTVKLCLNNGP